MYKPFILARSKLKNFAPKILLCAERGVLSVRNANIVFRHDVHVFRHEDMMYMFFRHEDMMYMLFRHEDIKQIEEKAISSGGLRPP